MRTYWVCVGKPVTYGALCHGDLQTVKCKECHVHGVPTSVVDATSFSGPCLLGSALLGGIDSILTGGLKKAAVLKPRTLRQGNGGVGCLHFLGVSPSYTSHGCLATGALQSHAVAVSGARRHAMHGAHVHGRPRPCCNSKCCHHTLNAILPTYTHALATGQGTWAPPIDVGTHCLGALMMHSSPTVATTASSRGCQAPRVQTCCMRHEACRLEGSRRVLQWRCSGARGGRVHTRARLNA